MTVSSIARSFGLVLGLALLLGASAQVLAENAISNSDVIVGTIDYPPFGIHEGTAARGIGVDIALEISKRTGIPMIPVQSFVSRTPELLKAPRAMLATITRIPEREGKMRWVGKIADDRYCFVTLKKSRAVSDIETAKKLKKVAANKGGATETFLLKHGFTNIDASPGSLGNVRKLFAGRVDAWFSTQIVSSYAIKSENLDPSETTCLGNLPKTSYWMATSNEMPDEDFNRIKKTYEQLEKEGFIKGVMKKYQ